MKHIVPFIEFKITENKENDINSSSLEKEIDFSNEILNDYSFKKIDYYYLKSNVDEMLIKEMYDMIENNEYRAFATFSDNIHYFEELPCTLIALVNYPAERFNKRTIVNKLAEVGKYDFVEEIEFPWSMKYIEFGIDFWRGVVLDYANKGIILRPMVEFGIYNDEDVKKVIDFFKQINILTIMTSSGMYPEITTIERWEAIKELIPNKWIVKVGGILTISDINKFIKSDVDLAATTISLKTVYGKELGLE